MLVSHRHKFIYTKTKKTAGTSVESYFEPYCMAENEWVQSHSRDEYISDFGIIGFRGSDMPTDCVWKNHMPAATIKNLLGDTIWNSYFKFCAIRNPYEKVLSFFFWCKRRGLISVNTSESLQSQFEHWLETAELPIDRDTYLIDNQFCLDDFIRYESLSTDLERICTHLKIPWIPSALPRFKSGKRPTDALAKDIYTQKSIEIVKAGFEFELNHFGYSFPADPA